MLRADSGFAREELMAWCETNGVDYVFGLARNDRLVGAIAEDLAAAEALSLAQGGPARRFADFFWSTLDNWSRHRRVVAKAERLPKGANPRFVVTSLAASAIDARSLYEHVYCARGQIENRMYGRLPPCKQGFFFAWASVVGCCYVSGLAGLQLFGLDEFRELAPDYQGELEALRFSRAPPTPVRPAMPSRRRSPAQPVEVSSVPRHPAIDQAAAR